MREYLELPIDEELTAGIQVPAAVIPYVEVFGLSGAVRFILHFGGAQLYIPSNPNGRGQLEDMFGKEAVRALSEKMNDAGMHDMTHRVPLANRWIAILADRSGHPAAEIARQLRVTDVSVRNWVKDGRVW